MSRRKRDRLYYREGRGWYADLRDYSDVGGRQEAMKRPGQRRATQDRDEASTLLAVRLAELDAARDGRTLGRLEAPFLRAYAERHLEVKAHYRRQSTVERDERSLRQVLTFFGDVRLTDIDVKGLTDYIAYRRQQPGSRRGSALSSQTILHELNALSSLFKRAVAENVVEVNPVSRLPEKPRVERDEKVWLEIGEASRLLAAGGNLDQSSHPRAIPFLRPILATFLLTGGRAQEVFGLEIRDIEFDGGIVHFRPNDWRRLKRNHHRRWVPLWPQLAEILRDYIESYEKTSGLLFPASSGGMIKDLRGSLKKALREAEIEKPITWHSFRHTYAAARLQTTDHGAPVSPYTVMRELGHRSFHLIEQTYGHLMNVRHRSAVVEYFESEIVELVSKEERRPA